jgi:bacterial/archaeal transporter family protein
MESHRWIFFGLLSAFSTALVTALGRLGVENIDSTLAVTIRTTITAIVLLGMLVGSGKVYLIKTVDNYSLCLLGLSALVYAVSWCAYFIALKCGPALKVDALDWTSILFVLAMTPLWGEALTWKSFFGAFLLILGTFFIAS